MRWIALLLLLCAPAFAENVPDTPLVTGPGFQQIPAPLVVITPVGGSQTTLGAALAAACPRTGCTFTGPLNMGTNLLDGSNIAFTGGSLNGVSVGATTPAAGAFTTLGASGAVTLTGGGTALSVTNNATVGGTFKVTGAVTGASFESPSSTGLIISPGPTHSITFGDPSYGIGNVATMSFASGANQLTVSNILQSQYWRTPGSTYSLSGSTYTSILNFISNQNGSFSGQSGFAYVLQIPTDTVGVTGGSGGFGVLNVISNFGGTGTAGNRTPYLVTLSQTAAISGDSSAQQYTGASLWLQSSFNAGGTNTSTSSKGSWYGLNPQIVLNSGATDHTLTNVWGEGDLDVKTGASVRDELGGSIILEATHAVAGARSNIVWLVGAQVGATSTWQNGYTYGGLDGPWAMASGATLEGTIVQVNCGGNSKGCQFPAQLATFGTDWSYVDFADQSGAAFRSAGFSVGGDGTVNVGAATIAPTSTGIAIDATNYTVTGTPSIVTAGSAAGDSTGQNNYWPGDVVYGPGNVAKGQYKVTTTKAIAGSVAAGGSGVTNGACTVTDASSIGDTAFQLSGTVTGGALTGSLTVATAGSYSSGDPFGATPASVAVTGCGLTGAKVYVGMGAGTISVIARDINSTSISGTKSTTGGSGSGLTLSMSSSQASQIKIGSTTAQVVMASLPTSCTGQATGTLWNNSSVLNVCP